MNSHTTRRDLLRVGTQNVLKQWQRGQDSLIYEMSASGATGGRFGPPVQ